MFSKSKLDLGIMIVFIMMYVSNATLRLNERKGKSPTYSAAKTMSSLDWSDETGQVSGMDVTKSGEIPIEICENQCSGHGTCKTIQTETRCVCNLGFSGKDCSKTICDALGCVHGTCKSPDMTVEPMALEDRTKIIEFYDAVNENKKFPVVKDVGCHCDEGWKGIRCDVKAD